MTKLIFLDIDGVMVPANCYIFKDTMRSDVSIPDAIGPSTYPTDLRNYKKFNIYAVEFLKRLLRVSRAKIVTNTVWNGLYPGDMLRWLIANELQMPESDIFFKTPKNDTSTAYGLGSNISRVDAVMEYLFTEPTVDTFVILDDATVYEESPLDTHWVNVDPANGFSANEYNSACDKLGLDKEHKFWVCL